MILIWLILSLLIGGGLAWISGRWSSRWPRWISLFTLGVHLLFLLVLWSRLLPAAERITGNPWIAEFQVSWIPQIGSSIHLAMDGLSLLLVVLANLLAFVAVAASWQEIQSRVGFFHFNLLWILAALSGVFLAIDLLLFYVFWELMLVPLYFLITIWGHEHRVYAAIKFFIFTQASGLLMLLAILGLYFVHGRATGIYTFDYDALLRTPMTAGTAMWLMLGFFVAFAVKLPMVPLHTWLADAHTEAPTAGSVDLAGLVLKVGPYGMLRFLFPLFPQAALLLAPWAMALGVVGILYGAIVALGQTDLKRLVAYSSISHMGFVLLGVFSWNTIAIQGAVMVMIAHGISTGALFVLVGELQRRLGTRQLAKMGGLWHSMPRLGGAGMVFAMASLGLPGLGNFVGELLVLLGTFQASPVAAIFATLGFVVATIYSLWMIGQVFFGAEQQKLKLPDASLSDVSLREGLILGSMLAVSVWLGMFPQTVLETNRGATSEIQKAAALEANTAHTNLHEHNSNVVIDTKYAITDWSAQGGRP